MAFTRLVRFVEGGEAVYGDLINSDGDTYTVRKLSGSPFETLQDTAVVVQTKQVSSCCHEPNLSPRLNTILQLLCPVERTPIVICIGLNYKTHAEEAKVRSGKPPKSRHLTRWNSSPYRNILQSSPSPQTRSLVPLTQSTPTQTLASCWTTKASWSLSLAKTPRTCLKLMP
jgi:hypothetical protein